MKGKVIATIGGVYDVYLENKQLVKVSPKGILKHKKKKIIVGDDVEVNLNDNTLDDVLDRKNMLIRPRISNIDLGVVVMSLAKPNYSSYLLDKFLTLLNLSSIEPLIILTKTDLVGEDVDVNKIINQYSLLGVKVLTYSKVTKEGLDEIKKAIKGKVIAFMGQTGVGKSSLINLIDEDFSRQVGEFSQALGRGKHQTKEVVLLPYKEGFIGDTPGFSSLELDIYKEDLANFFPLIKDYYTECRYSNCLHKNEPGCKIKELIEQGKFDNENYQNYLQMLDELIARKDRY